MRQGSEIASPSPRQYLQIRASILSGNPHESARLHSIQVNLADPVADRLIGEISPTLIDELGRPGELSFYLRPFFGSSRQGFDEIRIEASGDASLELVEVRAGSEGDFGLGRETVFELSELEVIDSSAGSLRFRFPDPLNRGVELVEVRLLATTYSTSTSFRAAGQDSRSPGWQRVDPGDATDLVDSQTTTLLALEGNQVIRGLEAGSRGADAERRRHQRRGEVRLHGNPDQRRADRHPHRLRPSGRRRRRADRRTFRPPGAATR